MIAGASSGAPPSGTILFQAVTVPCFRPKRAPPHSKSLEIDFAQTEGKKGLEREALFPGTDSPQYAGIAAFQAALATPICCIRVAMSK